MSEKLFRGIIPALYTCYHDDGRVNYDETVRLAEWLCAKGVGGFYLCGTTGEGLLLSTDERKKIVACLGQALGDKVPLMVHVGCMATSDSVELAQHAAGCDGVRAISSLAPQYYPMPLKDQIKHLSVIAQATDLPFYPYLFSTAVDAHGIDALLEAFAQIPNMAGIKAFVTNLAIHQQIIKKGPSQWELLHGFDECLFHGLCIPGVDGSIGSTYNVLPEITVAIYNHVKQGNFAEAIALQEKFGAYWMAVYRGVILPLGRHFLQKRGFKMGPPRAPLCAPDPDTIRSVEQAVPAELFQP